MSMKVPVLSSHQDFHPQLADTQPVGFAAQITVKPLFLLTVLVLEMAPTRQGQAVRSSSAHTTLYNPLYNPELVLATIPRPLGRHV